METTIGGSSILFVGFTLRLKGISHDFSNTSERRGVHCSGGGCLEVRNRWLKTNTWVLERSGRCFKRIGSSLSIEDHPKCRKTHRKSKTTQTTMGSFQRRKAAAKGNSKPSERTWPEPYGRPPGGFYTAMPDGLQSFTVWIFLFGSGGFLNILLNWFQTAQSDRINIL